MPRYIYRCSSCKHEFEARHMMSEKLEDCPVCESEKTLFRVPSILKAPPSSGEISERARPIGSVVDEFITSAKEEIRKEKKRMKSQEIK